MCHKVNLGNRCVTHGVWARDVGCIARNLSEYAADDLCIAVDLPPAQNLASRGASMCRIGQLIGECFIGHETVDDDVATRGQTLCGSLQAFSLLVFGEQIEQRVVGNKHHTKRAEWHIADHVPEVRFDQRAVGLCTQLIEHRL